MILSMILFFLIMGKAQMCTWQVDGHVSIREVSRLAWLGPWIIRENGRILLSSSETKWTRWSCLPYSTFTKTMYSVAKNETHFFLSQRRKFLALKREEPPTISFVNDTDPRIIYYKYLVQTDLFVLQNAAGYYINVEYNSPHVFLHMEPSSQVGWDLTYYN